MRLPLHSGAPPCPAFRGKLDCVPRDWSWENVFWEVPGVVKSHLPFREQLLPFTPWPMGLAQAWEEFLAPESLADPVWSLLGWGGVGVG